MAQPPKGPLPVYSPFSHAEGSNQAMVSYALNSRISLLQRPRTHLAGEIGVSPAQLAWLLRSPSNDLPLLPRVVSWLDEEASMSQPEITKRHSLESFTRNRMPERPNRSNFRVSLQTFRLSEVEVRNPYEALSQGAMLLQILLADENPSQRERRFFSAGHRATQCVTDLATACALPIGDRMAATNILGQLLATAPRSVGEILLDQVARSPIGWQCLRALRNALRLLRSSTRGELEASTDDSDPIRIGIWILLERLMDMPMEFNTYPSRSLLLAAVGEYINQNEAHPIDNREHALDWVIDLIGDGSRSIRERMYASWIATDTLRRYSQSEASDEDIELATGADQRAVIALNGAANEDSGLSYAREIRSLMDTLDPHSVVDQQPDSDQIIGSALPLYTSIVHMVDAAIADQLPDWSGQGRKGRAGAIHDTLPSELRPATVQLIAVCLMTLDGARRRSALETLINGGTFGYAIPIFRQVAQDAATPQWLVEISVFALAYSGQSEVSDTLASFSRNHPNGSSRNHSDAVRHAALWGLAEMPVSAEHTMSSTSPVESDARHLALFTRHLGLPDSDAHLDSTAEVWDHPAVIRAAAYGIALSRERRLRPALLQELEGSSDSAVIALARWGRSLVTFPSSPLGGELEWIGSLPYVDP